MKSAATASRRLNRLSEKRQLPMNRFFIWTRKMRKHRPEKRPGRKLASRLFAVLSIGCTLTGALAGKVPEALSLEECVQFVERREGRMLDTRPAEIYQRGHLPGAVNLPLKDFDTAYERLKGMLEADFTQRMAVYCTSVNCTDSQKVQTMLAGKGFTRVAVFKGGYAAWWKAGLPIVKGPEPGLRQPTE